MALRVLPQKYYLTHFYELIDFLEAHYQHLLEEKHKKFLTDFRRLSEEAQCLYVRMVNRKGVVFNRREFFKYKEVADADAALSDLRMFGFWEPLSDKDKFALLEYLKKGDLKKWLAGTGFNVKSSCGREEMAIAAFENLHSLSLENLEKSEELIVQSRVEELEYILFLYFGRIHKSLDLYALRDLGIRQTHALKQSFKPRFANLRDALTEFAIAKRVEAVEDPFFNGDLQEVFNFCREQKNLRTSAQNMKDRLLLDIGGRAEAKGNTDLALQVWGECRQHPAREKIVRLQHKLDRRDEAKIFLEGIVNDPWCDEEVLFAEDFLDRKFGNKRKTPWTEMLQNAAEIALSEFYLKNPEQGVSEHFRRLGFEARHTENRLWNSLFGLLFWEELFESEKAGIHNPFERSPIDLVGFDFYGKNKESIEEKLANLDNVDVVKKSLMKKMALHYGKRNDIFIWHPHSANWLIEFLQASAGKNLAHVIRKMAQSYRSHHSGFPDLLFIKGGVAKFVEVKAQGDVLRTKQLSKVRLLKEAGFEVEVLKVRWQADPNQVYVVLDVETTGGMSQFHRVIEVGALKIQNGKVIDEFQSLINPRRRISAGITGITGITNEMVANAPVFADIAEQLMEFTKDAVFVAHNARFDYGFIQREFQRLNMDFVRPQLCTCATMRKLYPGLASYKLSSLAALFQIPLENHHRALCDAKAAAGLLNIINDKRERMDVKS